MGRQATLERRTRAREEFVHRFRLFVVELSRADGAGARANVVVCMDEPLAAEALAKAVIANAGWSWQAVLASRPVRVSGVDSRSQPLCELIGRAVKHVVAWDLASPARPE